MERQTEILDYIAELTDTSIGQVSPTTEYAFQFAGGNVKKRYLDGSCVCAVRVQCTGRSSNQQDVSDRLCRICDTLENIGRVQGDGWEIRRITVGTYPAPRAYLESERVWMYSCMINIEYYAEKTTNRR